MPFTFDGEPIVLRIQGGLGGRPSVSQDGSEVAGQAADINFTGNVSVVNDDDGTVTVTITPTTPGGADSEIQFNNGGSFAGASGVEHPSTGKLVMDSLDVDLVSTKSFSFVVFQVGAQFADDVEMQRDAEVGRNMVVRGITRLFAERRDVGTPSGVLDLAERSTYRAQSDVVLPNANDGVLVRLYNESDSSINITHEDIAGTIDNSASKTLAARSGSILIYQQASSDWQSFS